MINGPATTCPTEYFTASAGASLHPPPLYSARHGRTQVANMYSVRAYTIGYAFAELPCILFIALAFCSIIYWVTGLAGSAEQFLFYW